MKNVELSKGCRSPKRNLIGKRFGRLVVKEFAGRNQKSVPYWLCQCDCGNYKIIENSSLIYGRTKSCGCYNSEIATVLNTNHGESKTKIYSVWNSMIGRCERTSYWNYKRYGGRGIKVCDEWHDFEKFKDWAYSTGYDENAPRGACTLDRINSNGNYEPENCRWANAKQQTVNREATKLYTINGTTLCFSDWCKKYNRPKTSVKRKMDLGMSLIQALSETNERKAPSML